MAFPAGPVNGQTYVDPTDGQYYEYDSALNMWFKIPTPPAARITQVLAVTSFGQTAFTLGNTPVAPPSVDLYVNGVRYVYSADFVVAGTALMWGGPFDLEVGDEMIAIYEV